MWKKRTTNITHKIMHSILRIYLILLVCCFLISVVFLLPMMKKVADRNTENSLEGLKTVYNSIVKEGENYLNTLLGMKELRNYLTNISNESGEKQQAQISLYLDSFQNINEQILYTTILDVQTQRLYGSFYFDAEQMLEILKYNPYYTLMIDQTRTYQSPFYEREHTETQILNVPCDYVCFSSAPLTIGDSKYIFSVFYNADSWIQEMENIRQNTLDSFLLCNKQQEIVYSTWDSKTSEDLVRKLNAKEIPGEGWIPGKYFYMDLNSYKGGILGYATWKTYFSELILLDLVILVLIILPIVIIYFSNGVLNRKYLSSLQQLADHMRIFQIGQDPPPLVGDGDEIGTLSKVFRRMVWDINAKTENIKKQEQEKSIAMYKVLTTQLDPHFVSNTMSIINVMARHGQTQDIIAVNNALLHILRDRLKSNGSIMASVAEEIAILKDYMLIIRYRYQNQVSIEYDISEEVNQKLILKNILQLLVENSLFHGLMGKDEAINGEITVMIYVLDEEIIIEVSDDGCGIEEEALHKLNANQFRQGGERAGHIGLRNIYERLTYIYGERFTMEILSELGEGTTVVIAVPIDVCFAI